MPTRPFAQVDVFTAVPLLGNPVAVILDAKGLDAATMQRIANWTNLSETTFVTAATDRAASYAVRIFTPKSELPFAGHPTLGTAHALIEAGIVTPKDGGLVQQCEAGLVGIGIGKDGLSFKLPRYAATPAPAPDQLLAAIFNQGPPHLDGEVASRSDDGGVGGGRIPPRTAPQSSPPSRWGGAVVGTPQILDVGPRWVIAELASAAEVELLAPDLAALAAYDRAHHTTGLTVFASGAAGGLTVRSFAPADGVAEDPVCGSGNGAVAAYRLLGGQVKDGDAWTASQGRQVGRDGQVRVWIDGRDVHVGGACVTCVRGELLI